LKALSRDYDQLRFTILRYFNPIGSLLEFSHGENINDDAENLFPNIILSIKKTKKLIINGNQYKTDDGTAVRDFIHISDLANGHIACLNFKTKSNFNIFNLGTGKGTTILNLIERFNELSGRKINFTFGPNRPSDISISYSSPKKANHILDWHAKKTLDEMILDSWNFYSKDIL
jgi:UDP-glucose 4-epimerase